MSDAPIIIGGCGRSGTTLLRMMLDAHPRIACGPELKLAPLIVEQFQAAERMLGLHLERQFGLGPSALASAYGGVLRSLLERYRIERGKARVAEKTPQNIHHFATLGRLLPEAHLVHLIRDGRDVVASLLQQNWVDLATGREVAYTKTARAAARFWAAAVGAGRAVRGGPGGERYREIRYEALVEDPEASLRDLLEHCGEGWDPAMLEFHRHGTDLPVAERASHGDSLSQPLHGRAIGRWRHALSDVQKEAIKEEAGSLLVELGYAQDDTW